MSSGRFDVGDLFLCFVCAFFLGMLVHQLLTKTVVEKVSQFCDDDSHSFIPTLSITSGDGTPDYVEKCGRMNCSQCGKSIFPEESKQ